MIPFVKRFLYLTEKDRTGVIFVHSVTYCLLLVYKKHILPREKKYGERKKTTLNPRI